MPSGAVLEGRPPPLCPRALACLVSRDSELAYLFRSLIKLTPPPVAVASAQYLAGCVVHARALAMALLEAWVSRLAWWC
jgi:hypothetical protein